MILTNPLSFGSCWWLHCEGYLMLLLGSAVALLAIRGDLETCRSFLEQWLWWQKEKQTIVEYTRVLPGSVNAEVPKPFSPSVPVRWWQSKYFHEPKGESCSPRIIFLALGPELLDPWAETICLCCPCQGGVWNPSRCHVPSLPVSRCLLQGLLPLAACLWGCFLK